MDVDRSRRRFLATLGGAAVLAGCSQRGTSDGGATTTPGARSAAPAPGDSTTPSEESRWEIEPVEHDKLVGAHYYPWYGQSRDWRNWLRKVPGRPLLGEYNSEDAGVINQHVEWAREHGINWFSMSWAGPAGEHHAGYHDDVLKNHFLEAELGDQIQFSILYESITQLRSSESGPVNFDEEAVREKLRGDFEYLEEAYFDLPTYVTVGDRPLVFIYATFNFAGAVGDAFREAKDAIDAEPYLVADRTFHEPWMGEFDAVTAYSHYRPSVVEGASFSDFVDYVETETRTGAFATREAGLGYIPNVMPGMNDTLVPGRDNPVLERDPEGFREMCRTALDYVDGDLDAVLVTSFNEWPEYTSVEPAESFGTTYLEIVEERLAKAEPSNVANDYDVLEFDFNRTVRPDGADRELALMLDTLELRSENGTPTAKYDVGVADEEPYFVEGAFPPERNTDPESDWDTWRWLGGPTGRAVIYLGPDLQETASATFRGTPVEEGIEAEISFNDSRTDFVEFGDRGLRTYSVSLLP